ncbi:hypothetical protein B0H14DRAFT_2651138 [Mycena olivaceomarginata]|nr:hypothetical protein B0H14DRAFT_2651138 [Mycena olivaceomarginata]
MKLADKFNGETILGASYLPPGCFHDLVGAPGIPTKYFWVLPCISSNAWEHPEIFGGNTGSSQPNMGGRSQVCELSMGAPIAPTEGSWEHPASLTGSIHGITERLLGASRYITWVVPSPLRNIVGGSQDYYKRAPMAVRRELPCTLDSPECRSVKNPVEAGNVFCASVEGGYRGAVSQAEG